jgi:hypothetical protein
MQSKTIEATVSSLLFFLCGATYAAVVIPIDAPAKDSASSKDPTLTMLYEAEKPATATIVYMPGHNGQQGISAGMTEVKGALDSPLGRARVFAADVMAPLAKTTFNVVIVDTPYPLLGNNMWISSRSENDHLDRIESVVKFYKARLKAPVWLFGQSNGSASVAAFINRSNENRQLLSGAVFSSSRNEISLATDVALPMVFLHHKSDGCKITTYDSALANFEKFKKLNKAEMKFVTIQGGSENRAPCSAEGLHMYAGGAEQEATTAIEKSLTKN